MRKLFILMAVVLALGARAAAAGSDVEGCAIDQPGKPAAPCSTAPSAASFGLQQGDVVVSVDGKKITNPDDTKAWMDRLASGNVKRVVVLRNGQRKTLTRSK